MLLYLFETGGDDRKLYICNLFFLFRHFDKYFKCHSIQNSWLLIWNLIHSALCFGPWEIDVHRLNFVSILHSMNCNYIKFNLFFYILSFDLKSLWWFNFVYCVLCATIESGQTEFVLKLTYKFKRQRSI